MKSRKRGIHRKFLRMSTNYVALALAEVLNEKKEAAPPNGHFHLWPRFKKPANRSRIWSYCDVNIDASNNALAAHIPALLDMCTVCLFKDKRQFLVKSFVLTAKWSRSQAFAHALHSTSALSHFCKVLNQLFKQETSNWQLTCAVPVFRIKLLTWSCKKIERITLNSYCVMEDNFSMTVFVANAIMPGRSCLTALIESEYIKLYKGKRVTVYY